MSCIQIVFCFCKYTGLSKSYLFDLLLVAALIFVDYLFVLVILLFAEQVFDLMDQCDEIVFNFKGFVTMKVQNLINYLQLLYHLHREYFAH